MCLLFVSYRSTPGHRLVVAANRDEFLDRPTAALHYLDAEQMILAGQDLEGGGTWLGITRNGKFGAITNYREPAHQLLNAPSRGEILLNYFRGNSGAAGFLEKLTLTADQYNGFNLVLSDGAGLYYYSNRISKPQQLQPGFYGLSNHLLETPWPKVIRGKELLAPHMATTETIEPDILIELLGDSWRPQDSELPDTGVSLEWERLLSSIFIDSPAYGTRSTAVITLSESGVVEFYEKTFLRSAQEVIEPVLVTFSMNE